MTAGNALKHACGALLLSALMTQSASSQGQVNALAIDPEKPFVFVSFDRVGRLPWLQETAIPICFGCESGIIAGFPSKSTLLNPALM